MTQPQTILAAEVLELLSAFNCDGFTTSQLRSQLGDVYRRYKLAAGIDQRPNGIRVTIPERLATDFNLVGDHGTQIEQLAIEVFAQDICIAFAKCELRQISHANTISQLFEIQNEYQQTINSARRNNQSIREGVYCVDSDQSTNLGGY